MNFISMRTLCMGVKISYPLDGNHSVTQAKTYILLCTFTTQKLSAAPSFNINLVGFGSMCAGALDVILATWVLLIVWDYYSGKYVHVHFLFMFAPSLRVASSSSWVSIALPGN